MPKQSFLKNALIVLAVVSIFSPRASATSVTDFEAMSVKERSDLLGKFIDKMIADLKPVNPQLAQKIDDYFYKAQPGRQISDGLTDFNGEILAIDDLAKEGKLDPKKIPVEGVIVHVVRTKFPPDQNQPATRPAK
jgi:hypothetical protein